jgi:hypothetical protein
MDLSLWFYESGRQPFEVKPSRLVSFSLVLVCLRDNSCVKGVLRNLGQQGEGLSVYRAYEKSHPMWTSVLLSTFGAGAPECFP